MHTYKVLVPIEDEYFGNLIADYICEHEWPKNVSFQVMHVFPPAPNQPPLQSYIEYQELCLEAAWRLVEKISARIRNTVNHALVDEIIWEGYPKEQIIEAARTWKPEMIVMGAHGRADADTKTFPLGSVSAAVTVHAPCSVLVVRPDHSIGIGPIKDRAIGKVLARPAVR